MQNILYRILTILFILIACGIRTYGDARPNRKPLPTETITNEAFPSAEIPGLFGMLNNADVQASLMPEPVVSQIFELKLEEWIEAGQIEEYQVERLGVYPKGDATLHAKVVFRVKTDGIFWPEDGGTEEDGWVTEKCAHFDFAITEDAYQLLNKRLCSEVAPG